MVSTFHPWDFPELYDISFPDLMIRSVNKILPTLTLDWVGMGPMGWVRPAPTH
uniref:Uncharacterized protein n=2 Tax=Picea TaxID=3328 RepID=A0A101M480_PICGL|nr:hypothetical protein ABT39_MTgene615 [Picea glauca]QHR92770.1 hypothetical protein Q903MT_gene6818 [Picea sitchensis]